MINDGNKYKVEYVLAINKPKPYFVPCYGKINKKPTLNWKEAYLASEGCDGVIIGTYHPKGEDAILAWYEKHPDWEERYLYE